MSEEKVLVKEDELLNLVSQIFIRNGASKSNAKSAASALLAAEARGQTGHGLSRVQSYSAQLKAGKIDGQAVPEVIGQQGGALRIDAKSGFAYPALDLVTQLLPQIAKAQQISAAAITNSHHAGALGVVIEKLANEGLVVLMFANTPKAIAPFGGSQALFGTNPIGFAAPRKDAPPLVIDMALSNTARGKIMAASQSGESIPEGWALDENGQPTTDPDEALKGTMIAIGDAKGAALALMVEILAVALTGSIPSFHASSFLNDQGPAPNVGQLIIAIDPGAMSGGLFDERMAQIIEAIQVQTGTRLPGEKGERAVKAIADQGGFLIQPEVLEKLRSL